MITIALAGNPNCGKTTLFNLLTGSDQSVGNWPGVTVEKKEGILKGHPEVRIQDLPGIYSLSPYSPEERITRRYLVRQRPDVILNLVDGTNMERNLYLTAQLMELDVPIVLAVNMMDLVRKKGDSIDLEALTKETGCPCIEISARTGEGVQEAAGLAVKSAEAQTGRMKICCFQEKVEETLKFIERSLENRMTSGHIRWCAVKLFERDEAVKRTLNLPRKLLQEIEKRIKACERVLGDDAESLIADQRYRYVEKIVRKAVHKKEPDQRYTLSDRIDNVVTDRILAMPIFALTVFILYTIAMGNFPFSVGSVASSWVNDVLFGIWIPGAAASALNALKVSGWVYSLVMDGILTGVGSVLGFLPQIMVLTFLLGMLEDVGYMSRVAFIMDRLFRKFGLSGKSVIPMLVSAGCSVPGILASRTIERENDRKITVMTVGFIPCSAKMPMIGLFAGAVFGNSPLASVIAFFAGIAAMAVSGVILKKCKAFAGESAPFVMEMPAYHLPSVKNALRCAADRGGEFAKRAASVVLLGSAVMWFLKSFGFSEAGFTAVEDSNRSLLACMGTMVSWMFAPIGWQGNMAWKAVAATAAGLIAKEQVVMTLAALYRHAGTLSESGREIWHLIGEDFGPASAASFVTFNLLCAPCIAAVSAIRREMGSRRWTLITVGYLCGFSYAVSLIIYQLAGLVTGEAAFGGFTILALAAVAGMIYLCLRKAGCPEEGACAGG